MAVTPIFWCNKKLLVASWSTEDKLCQAPVAVLKELQSAVFVAALGFELTTKPSVCKTGVLNN